MPFVLARFDELIACFNRRVMDVPDGLFDRDARFSLNGATFESILGQRDDDPLVRMIARGAAAYRFAAKPLLHAFETVLVSRMDYQHEGSRVRIRLTLRGTLRGTGELLDELVDVDMALTPEGSVARTDVAVSERTLQQIKRARAS
jgi:hypothetical protein